MSDFIAGQAVRYTMDDLGAVRSSFTAKTGDRGFYVGPIDPAAFDGRTDWHLTQAASAGGLVVIPVHADMFELVPDGETLAERDARQLAEASAKAQAEIDAPAFATGGRTPEAQAAADAAR